MVNSGSFFSCARVLRRARWHKNETCDRSAQPDTRHVFSQRKKPHWKTEDGDDSRDWRMQGDIFCNILRDVEPKHFLAIQSISFYGYTLARASLHRKGEYLSRRQKQKSWLISRSKTRRNWTELESARVLRRALRCKNRRRVVHSSQRCLHF